MDSAKVKKDEAAVISLDARSKHEARITISCMSDHLDLLRTVKAGNDERVVELKKLWELWETKK
jgi:hypothetical protein